MSHFSFTRNAYDKCAMDLKNTDNEAIFSHNTDSTITESSSSCFVSYSPFMAAPQNSVPSSIIDTESELRGQSQILGKCPSNRFNPMTSQPIQRDIRLCSDEVLMPEYTRINKPCNIFSGININRFHPLCEDLQDLNKIHSNNYIGSNSRLDVKDAHDNQKRNKSQFDFKFDPKNPCRSGSLDCKNLLPQ